jgi:glucosyl-dolichyl phosphate glucuronosyltransferase
MAYSVIIATHNRAVVLAETLDALSRLQTSKAWEVIVVDNNSSDNTRQVVEDAQTSFTKPLRYLFEPEPGKAAALNTAIRHASGDILLFTDDDALVEPDWLGRADAALTETGADYVGGRVRPRWEREPPRWLSARKTRISGVIALLDCGDTRREFGKGIGWPLGVNMAVRADVFRVHGFWWDNRYDRVGNTLRGQGQREWCLRLRSAGLHGFYEPQMVVHHLVPAERLMKGYFRRWFYWLGVSRAMLYVNQGLDMESPEDRPLDSSSVPHIAGVPRYMIRTAVYHLRESVRQTLLGRWPEAFEHELWVCFFAGVMRQRWNDRRIPIGTTTSLEASVPPALSTNPQ